MRIMRGLAFTFLTYGRPLQLHACLFGDANLARVEKKLNVTTSRDEKMSVDVRASNATQSPGWCHDGSVELVVC